MTSLGLERLAGGVPSEGDVFDVPGYRLTVTRMEGRRIEEVVVEPTGDQP